MELQQLAVILKFSKGGGWVSQSQQEAYMQVSQVRTILEKEDEVASFYTHGSIFPKLCTSVLGPGKGFAMQPSLTRKKALTGCRASPGIRLCQASEPHQVKGFANACGSALLVPINNPHSFTMGFLSPWAMDKQLVHRHVCRHFHTKIKRNK